MAPFIRHPWPGSFLELNETTETLEFDIIPGDNPKRGLLQADINLHGIRYLQQIKDAHVLGSNGLHAGIHVEPGLWLTIPFTTNPNDPQTVARIGDIPHDTSFIAQGTSLGTINQAPPFQPASITPFKIGNPASLVPFPESDLFKATPFRTPASDIPNVTQAMVDNPNLVLEDAIKGQHIISTANNYPVPI